MKSSKICVATNQVSSLSAYWRNIFVACTFCMSHLSKYFIYNKINIHAYTTKKNKLVNSIIYQNPSLELILNYFPLPNFFMKF